MVLLIPLTRYDITGAVDIVILYFLCCDFPNMQVLVGSLELVIFERFEPQYKADFDLILQRAGYDADRKTMLLDAHLRALR